MNETGVIEQLQRARQCVTDISTGRSSMIMTIPARPDNWDVLICNAIDQALAEIRRLRDGSE